MAGYLIIDSGVCDPVRYARYQALTPVAMQATGADFLIRGGRSEVLEGDWQPSRLVVVRFPSFDAACSFPTTPLYRKAADYRRDATTHFNMVVVEGA